MLFDKLVIERMRSTTSDVTIITGKAFGHKILTVNDYRFIELDDSTIMVEHDNFHAKCTTWEQVEFILNSVK